MDDGCVLSGKSRCEKYKIECMGYALEKRKCPIWAEALELERFYSKKFKLITKLEIEKYDSKEYDAYNI